MYSHLTVGILALQGAVSEHKAQVERLGAKAILVKNKVDLTACDALILPGGESTAIGKMMRSNGLLEAIQTFSAQQKPIFGTCAGMILLAKALENDPISHLCLMDIKVQRNAFGRQIDSFQTDLNIQGIEKPFPAVFIRAPYITARLSDKVQILATFENEIVLAQQNNLLACAFHPELTDDLSVMKLFLDMVK